MLNTIKASVERQWYGVPHWLFLLWPLMALYKFLAARRRRQQQTEAVSLPVPVMVVGNINVGGTGKTPVLIALAEFLARQGFKPGIIARGYGGDVKEPTLVTSSSGAQQVGDEPVLIARATQLPVVVSSNRVASAQKLIAEQGCDLILSDDGLQHYRLARDVEWVIVDGERGFGNGYCLPVGPLREPASRIESVAEVLVNGDNQRSVPATNQFTLKPLVWQNVSTLEQRPLIALDVSNAVAVAGIGNPQRFFNTLLEFGFTGATYAFADHHPYQASDFTAFGDAMVLMTSKDAVKCQAFAKSNWWALVVGAELPPELLNKLAQQLHQRVL